MDVLIKTLELQIFRVGILPPSPVKADLRAAQIKASEDVKRKFSIGLPNATTLRGKFD